MRRSRYAEPMHANRLRHTVIFQSNLATRNASGGWAQGTAWVPQVVCTVRACIEPLNGRESFDGEWTTSANAYKFSIYWRDDITEQMRIVFGTRIFQIREARQVAKIDRFMEIGAEEIRT